MRAEPAAVSRERYEGKGAAGRFYGGDTLLLMDELLRRYAGEVKLIYMDPPFLTGEQFIMRARVGAADWKAGKGSLVLPAFSDDMEPDAYYAMMRRVLEGCHSLLREDGMLFLHCDFRASARLRLIMDDIFGEKNLLNEIVWVYHTGGMARRYFSRKHDTILFYRKTGKYDFNIDAVLCPPTEPKQNHMRRHVDPDGRVYRSIRSGGRVYTYYDDDPVPPTDVWDDVSHLQQRDPQRTGYDTQKPLALLTRIVRCASREGELVFDPFCRLGHHARSRRARRPPLSGRGHVPAGAQHTAPPPRRRAVGAFARGGDGRRRLHSGSAARRGLLPRRACGHPHAVGDARQLGAGLSARRGIARGYAGAAHEEGPGTAPGTGAARLRWRDRPAPLRRAGKNLLLQNCHTKKINNMAV